jgi:signal transduction histidine kinase
MQTRPRRVQPLYSLGVADDLHHLLSLISHELRAPLGVMRGYLRLLEQRADMPEASREAVAAALRASARAADLLGQVSTLAQIERRETVFELQPVAVVGLLAALADKAALPGDPTITLSLGACADVRVMADRARLADALTSLATAVVRAQAHAAATISCRIVDEGPRGCEIAVDRSEMPRETTLHDLDIGRGGLGLDLPIAAAIVAAHHGRIVERRAGTVCVGMVVWLPTA